MDKHYSQEYSSQTSPRSQRRSWTERIVCIEEDEERRSEERNGGHCEDRDTAKGCEKI